MGDLNAVVVAQEAHLGLLEMHGIRVGAGNLGAASGFPRGPVRGGSWWCEGGAEEGLYGVYIDDLCALALAPWSRSNSSKSSSVDPSRDLSVGMALVQKAGEAYEAEGWPKPESKA